MRILFVTAADEAYAPLLRGMVCSLQQWQPHPYTDLAFFDLGLSADNANWIRQHARHVREPGWDLPVSDRVKTQEPHARALTTRPFLRDYFPGYDVYLWIDPDSWVQERYALDGYLGGAARGAMVITPQVHHAYRHTQSGFIWRAKRLQAYFGQPGAQRLSWGTYFNAGVFALPANAPHWAGWRQAFEAGLKATDGDICCDQTALNYMLWTKDMPVTPLPATCNWLCHLAAPGYDAKRQRFCEPVMPGTPLGILHLAANSKDMRITVRDARGTREMALHFPGIRNRTQQT
jgi:lipopolysaccharide biosynthesis glycosyltransferase